MNTLVQAPYSSVLVGHERLTLRSMTVSISPVTNTGPAENLRAHPPAAGRRRSSLSVQRSVLFALYLRELKTRFGSHRLGYLWVVLEPLTHVGALLMIFAVLNARTMPNFSFPVFLASGVSAWMLFNHTVIRAMAAMSANQGLMGFSPVKPIDTVITRLLVELLMFLAGVIVLWLIAWWVDHPVAIANPLLLAYLIASLSLFGGSIGLIFAIITHRQPDVGKFVPMIMRPLYFVSGVFFMLAGLPSSLRDWALLNPMVHWLDLIRVAVIENYPDPIGSLFVISATTAGSLLLSLMLYRIRRFDLVAS